MENENFNFDPSIPNYSEEGKETLKLIKNSRGYNWEIKLKSELISEADLKRLEDLDRQLNETYGNVA